MIGKNLYFLYRNRENHELGKVLDLPDPRFSDSYDRFLTFIRELRLNELEALCFFYLATKPEEYFDDDEFVYSLWLSSTLKVSKLDQEMIANDYIRKFPNGKYVDELTQN